MFRTSSRRSALAASCIAMLAMAAPASAHEGTDPLVLAEVGPLVEETEDPQKSPKKHDPHEAMTCTLDPGAQTLRERLVEWWRQNRALTWLSRAVRTPATSSPRRAAPAPSYHLRSPLLSGLIVEPAPTCEVAAEPEPADTVASPPVLGCDGPCESGSPSGPSRESRRRSGPTL